ncbi:DNA recombination protein RmuC [Blochmannia endosymbiont of Camponotus nipponensis]|uniref:DNA recombination protein RmuC n=1 Tax=Blochmannia endosymbiont of Camponotus nipponensis TaxID=2681986 RepID=UPI00135A70BE|nr:DNA recombination protein RmuC [Blochmannia endosymbiont of Camponotus nipponensis]
MTVTLFCIYNFLSMLVGVLISGIFFNIIGQRYIKKYKNDYTAYEHALCMTTQNLKNESTLRYNIEQKLQNELQIVYELHGKLSTAEERLKLLDHYHQKCEQLNHELRLQLNLNHTQELKLQELNIRLEEYKLAIEEKQKLFIDSENRLTMQFENLANRIFEQNGCKVDQQNRITLDRMLHPLKEQLEGFKSQMENGFAKEEESRNILTYEIRNLHQLNAKITQETINLTQALKGNNKTQGGWGEVILTRALEASGMREGYEFHVQVSIKQKDGHRLQPDVIIHLPHGKDVIIDSKVSLIAYERYFNSDNEEDRRLAIIDHVHSLRSHIKSLSKKDYQKLFGLNTLDYILMFVPIESAFMLAIKKEISLLTDAMRYNIMLISPTTLLIALRTINNLWRYENQNCHAKKIADKAGRLYDKLRLFMDDLNKIGFYLNKAEVIYSAARNKFSEGKGNIISQVEGFRTLGVQIKQPIGTSSMTSNSLVVYDENNSSSNSSNCEDSVTHNICHDTLKKIL